MKSGNELNQEQATSNLMANFEDSQITHINKAFYRAFRIYYFNLDEAWVCLANSLITLTNQPVSEDFKSNSILLAKFIIHAKPDAIQFVKYKINNNSIFSLLIKAMKANKIPYSLLEPICWPVDKEENDLVSIIEKKSQQELEQYFISRLKPHLDREHYKSSVSGYADLKKEIGKIYWNSKRITYLTDELTLKNKALSSKIFDKCRVMPKEKIEKIKEQIEYNKFNKNFYYEVRAHEQYLNHDVLFDALRHQKIISHVNIIFSIHNLKKLLDAIHDCGVVTHLTLCASKRIPFLMHQEKYDKTKYDQTLFLNINNKKNEILEDFFNKNKTVISFHLKSDFHFREFIDTDFKWLEKNTTIKSLSITTDGCRSNVIEDSHAFDNLARILKNEKSMITKLEIYNYISVESKNNLALGLANTKINHFVFKCNDDGYCYIKPKKFGDYFTTLILSSTNLTSLDLSDSHLNKKELLSLIILLTQKNQLRNLNISNCLFPNYTNKTKKLAIVEKLLEAGSQLTNLQLHHNNLNEGIVRKALTSEHFKSLSIDLCLEVEEFYHLLNMNQTLHELTIYCNPWQLQALCDQSLALQKNPYLYHLNINYGCSQNYYSDNHKKLDYTSLICLIDNLKLTSIIQLHIYDKNHDKHCYHYFPLLASIIDDNRNRFESDLLGAYCFAYFNVACFQGKFNMIKGEVEEDAQIREEADRWQKSFSNFPLELGQKIASYLPLLQGQIGEKIPQKIYIKMIDKVKAIR